MSHLDKILSVNLARPKIQLKNISDKPSVKTSDYVSKIVKAPIKLALKKPVPFKTDNPIIKTIKAPIKLTLKKRVSPTIEDSNAPLEANEDEKIILLASAAINSVESDKSETKFIELKKYNIDVMFRRAGIIPYFFDEKTDEYYFFFGIDLNHNELTDFGGMVNTGENFVDTAVREMSEESLNIFNCTSDAVIEAGKLIYSVDHSMAIILLPISFESESSAIENCNNICIGYASAKKKSVGKIENSNIMWLTGSDLKKLVLEQSTAVPIPASLQATINLTGFYPSLYKEVRRRLEPHFEQQLTL